MSSDSEPSEPGGEPSTPGSKRKRSYVPWSSRNCLKMSDAENVRELVFQSPLRPPTKTELKNGAPAGVMITQTIENSIVGRAHQEEAYMIFRKGEEQVVGEGTEVCGKCLKGDGKFAGCVNFGLMHNGSCANCVYQSDTNGCELAQANIEKLADDRLRMKKIKEKARRARGKGSSKTSKKMREVTNTFLGDDEGDGEEEDDDGMREIDPGDVLGAVASAGGKKDKRRGRKEKPAAGELRQDATGKGGKGGRAVPKPRTNGPHGQQPMKTAPPRRGRSAKS